MKPTCDRHFLFTAILGALVLASAAVRAADPPPAANYSGDLLTRSTLTGDWGGVRNDLANKGLTFDLSLTQTYVGVVDGGISKNWDYGGREDAIINLDTGRMGLWRGGFLSIEVEGNYGEGSNRHTGSLMPVNTNQLFPAPDNVGTVAIPALTYTQFLCEYFGVSLGKLPTLLADDNAFAHSGDGKGDTQFMNLALNANPLDLFTAPYTPLAVVAILLPTKDPNEAVVKAGVFSTTGKGNTGGFNELNGNDVSTWAEGRVRTGFLGMTGHQLLGGLYSNKEFTSIDQRLSLTPGTRELAKKSGSWAVYYNFDQYLYEPVKGSGRGFGIFGRLGASDGNPNFMQYFYSFGLGGKGLIPGRPDDTCGIGWYYIDIHNPQLSTPAGTREFLRDEQGGEAYYNIAITPWAHLTPDVQVIHGAQRQTISVHPQGIDTAVVLGARLRLDF